MDVTEIQFVPLGREGVFAVIDYADREEILADRWHVSGGYAVRRTSRAAGAVPRRIFMHRQILGIDPSAEGDHINRRKLDNRRTNLRPAFEGQNQLNRGKRSDNTSGYRGVYWDTKYRTWTAQITLKGKHRHLGRHETAELAAMRYDRAARELHGEFAVLNFPSE